MINKIKELFKRKKSKEAMAMWETLKKPKIDNYDPRIDPRLALDANHYMSLKSQQEKDDYITDLMHRRNEAYDKDR